MYKAYEQGAGRIQLKDSIQAKVLIYPSSLKFGKFKLNDGIHEHQETITIENTSTEPQKVFFSYSETRKRNSMAYANVHTIISE